MKPEHVFLSAMEREYGAKQLLNSQINILNFLKHFDAYRALRSEELILKIALKNKVNDAMKSLDVLERLLPKPTHQEEKTPKKKKGNKSERHKQNHKPSLEQEIEEIRSKLSKLH